MDIVLVEQNRSSTPHHWRLLNETSRPEAQLDSLKRILMSAGSIGASDGTPSSSGGDLKKSKRDSLAIRFVDSVHLEQGPDAKTAQKLVVMAV